MEYWERASWLRAIISQAQTGATPNSLFGRVPDDAWFWLNTEGWRQDTALRAILPGLPEETVQQRFTGAAGDKTLHEAFGVYTLIMQIARARLQGPLDKVLEFGCGWGRIIRFFLKDIAPSQLFGIDCLAEAIEICQQTNRWCRFGVVDPFPPTSFSDGSFDLIYCYAVFSHLSEDAHLRWLAELSRILRPGGLLIATTRPREFIEMCAQFRQEKARAFWLAALDRAFMDTAQTLRDYDEGRFVYEPLGGGGVLDPSFYGETCIPREYVRNHWVKHFEVLDYIDDRSRCLQNVIVVRKI